MGNFRFLLSHLIFSALLYKLVPYSIKAVTKNKKIWTAIKLDWLIPVTRHLSSHSKKFSDLSG